MNFLKTIWVVMSNSDLTEGRGYDYPIAVCESEITAIRLGNRKYVQGCDSPVKKMELIMVDGKIYAPALALNIIKPSKEDTIAQQALDVKRLAMEKARAAGLSDEDLIALGVL